MESLFEKVLMVGPDHSSPRGGVAMFINNIEILVFDGKMKSIANSCKGSKLKKVWVMLLAWIKMFFTLLFNREIKIVHINTSSNNSFWRTVYFVKLAKFFNRIVILHVHGGEFGKFYHSYVSKVRPVLDTCDGLIVLSKSWRDVFKNEIGYDKPIWVVNNVIAKPTLKESENDGLIHILFLGFIRIEKGVFELLEATTLIKDKLAGKAQIHICGVGCEEKMAMLKAMISDLDIDEVVKYEGWVDGNKKIALLNQCQIYVLPSHVEGLPVSILEAMSYGLAIVATPVGAIPEIVKNEENGYLVAVKDVCALSNAILTLVEDADKRYAYGEQSKRIADNYLPSQVKRQLLTIYNGF
ncbi:MAG: glycosyltransferase family 4 protein [Muribaculaceae bacterium]|nr:glycosyltransferase family 4 protein [Muribaculaceae bacterium]